MSGLTVFAPCYSCKIVFQFNAENVSSVLVDKNTQLPIEDNANITNAEPQPLCPPCVTAINEERKEYGLGPIPLPRPTLDNPFNTISPILRRIKNG